MIIVYVRTKYDTYPDLSPYVIYNEYGEAHKKYTLNNERQLDKRNQEWGLQMSEYQYLL